VSLVPANATGVVLNITAVSPTKSGFLTVFPTGSTKPLAATHNFTAGTTIGNLVFAKLGTGRSVDIYNFAGDTDLVADVVGYFGPTGGGGAGKMTPITPTRLIDTRDGGGAPLHAGASRTIAVRGIAGVPSTATAIIANVTAVLPTASGFFTAWASGVAKPLASNLNFSAGQVIGNLSIIEIGSDGAIQLFNFAGDTHAVIDIVGYVE
jgi:hypothetical protein